MQLTSLFDQAHHFWKDSKERVFIGAINDYEILVHLPAVKYQFLVHVHDEHAFVLHFLRFN